MLIVSTVLRTKCLAICIIFTALCTPIVRSNAILNSFSVYEKKCDEKSCEYLVSLRFSGSSGQCSWRLTHKEQAKGGFCDQFAPNYELRELESKQSQAILKIILPSNFGRFYYCLLDPGGRPGYYDAKWIHQGNELFLDTQHLADPHKFNRLQEETQESQNLISNLDLHQNTNWADLSTDIDINYRSPALPPKHEREDIQVLKTWHSKNNNRLRKKREIIQNNNKNIGLNNNKNINLFNNNYLFVSNNSYKSENNSIIMSKENIKHNITVDDFSDNQNNTKNINITKILSNDNINKNQSQNQNNNNLNDEKNAIIIKINNKTNNHEVNNKNESLILSKINIRNQRQVHPGLTSTFFRKDFDGDEGAKVAIEGLRIEYSDKEPDNMDGVPSVLEDSGVTLRLFGRGLSHKTVIVFTRDKMDYGEPCKYFLKGEYMAKQNSVRNNSALFAITAPPYSETEPTLYICAKNLLPGNNEPEKDEEKYYHQGTETWKTFKTHKSLMPLWASLVLVISCLLFSALFSGLNLGLMSLDKTELKIISNTGTEQERKYAKSLIPVRDHGNYLLCSILLGNVAVNSTFTILLDNLTSGLFAVIFSTLAIVLLGEITPQAICSRHGLMIGAKSIMITKAVMAMTAPLAYPVSKLLDYFLGEEIGNVYNRERLKELLKVTTGDLDKDEVNIISGALEMRKKTVAEIMTNIEDIYMLPIDSVLDFETMSEIIKSGYSRVPVYENTRSNIVTVLFIKDLAFVDPDDNTPLRTLCQYYQNSCNFVFEDCTLDVMFKQFKEGHKGHMAFVHRINSEGEGDPFYETTGLVTLEDVIEEMIQAEIVDETDVFLDNRSKRRRKTPQHKFQDFTVFAERHENQHISITPQMTLATYQFLSTSVEQFRPNVVSETVLRRLLRQDVIQHIKVKAKDRKDPSNYIYVMGKPADYFALILEGRVKVTVGRENLVFEAGPFTYFGVQALAQHTSHGESPTASVAGSQQSVNAERNTFVPDYGVRAITDTYYLCVKRSLYLAAKQATLMEIGAVSKGALNDQIDTEVDKLLQLVDENLSISGDHKTPSRQVSPNALPASPQPRPSLPSPEIRNGGGVIYRRNSEADEQEKLLQ